MTSNKWISPPPTPPIRPNSHRIIRTTRIVQSMFFPPYLNRRGVPINAHAVIVCRLKNARRALHQSRHTYPVCNRHSCHCCLELVPILSQRGAVSLRFHTDLRTAIEQRDCWRTRHRPHTEPENIRSGKGRCWQAITLTKEYLSERRLRKPFSRVL